MAMFRQREQCCLDHCREDSLGHGQVTRWAVKPTPSSAPLALTPLGPGLQLMATEDGTGEAQSAGVMERKGRRGGSWGSVPGNRQGLTVSSHSQDPGEGVQCKSRQIIQRKQGPCHQSESRDCDHSLPENGFL